MDLRAYSVIPYLVAGLVISGCKPVVTPEPVVEAVEVATPIATPTPAPTPKPTPKPTPVAVGTPADPQTAILEIAQKYVGERETHGSNRSPNIDRWNRFTGAPLGSPYCASYVSWVLHQAGIKNAPKSAWSPSVVNRNHVPFSEVEPADVFGLYFSSKGRIAHVGFVRNPDYSRTMLQTTEANTSPTAGHGGASDRDGDGCWNKLRSKKLMGSSSNKYSRYR
jgi:hypothetical protein